jgi:hypothetical protein
MWLGSGERAKGLATPTSRLDRLAASIAALAGKDELVFQKAREIAELRRSAAVELYRICSEFTAAVNIRLAQPELVIDPPEYRPESFNEDSTNLIQLNVRGRLLELEFEATPETISTEDFRVPYILKGGIRSFNQELLEHNKIEEQLIFYCVERDRHHWRFFDARTYRSGPFDQEYLVSLLERLL